VVGVAGVSAGATVVYEPARDQLAATAASLVRDGDVLLTLGAGDVTHVGPAVRQLLESR
jgi:UDP-N-acetylmuramate--alanine ligase